MKGIWAIAMLLLAGGAQAADEAQLARWREQVRAAECGFAASMARRDLAAFERHLAEPAVFFNGRDALQGRAAVLAAWKPFYEGAQAPFSWEPDQIVVVADGSLAYSTGPVRNPKGELTNRFASVWRQESPGRWLIVIDRGAPLTPADREAEAKTQPGKGCEGLTAPQ
ncbi:YybH family protein [Roseateles violae]|uniref:Nuclear transport factor 2 family protein n=1 Tax=Roseateles violae TaxID=3058042 RepID=A0ABT8DU52_9BURK|nr:nuclear transport factor 2 family protein [Pelomonas sp. PFR6]MDN3921819.1 nuclear transport factor 2 family protein [Pelomonas sp. PFR6]